MQTAAFWDGSRGWGIRLIADLPRPPEPSAAGNREVDCPGEPVRKLLETPVPCRTGEFLGVSGVLLLDLFSTMVRGREAADRLALAQDLFRGLHLALELFDLREGFVQRGVAGAFAGIGCFDELLLRGEGGLEALLFVVGGEPCVKSEVATRIAAEKRRQVRWCVGSFRLAPFAGCAWRRENNA